LIASTGKTGRKKGGTWSVSANKRGKTEAAPSSAARETGEREEKKEASLQYTGTCRAARAKMEKRGKGRGALNPFPL